MAENFSRPSPPDRQSGEPGLRDADFEALTATLSAVCTRNPEAVDTDLLPSLTEALHNSLPADACAHLAALLVADPQLQALSHAWPRLSESTRSAILSLVQEQATTAFSAEDPSSRTLVEEPQAARPQTPGED